LHDAGATPPARVVALMLVPETRGTGPVPLVAVGADALFVPLELRIDAAPAPGYEAALKDPATNGIVWRGRVAGTGRTPPPATVSVNVPAHLLNAQHYALDLFEVRHGAAGPFVASYAFEVMRR
jgi:hypothetical protein